MFGERHKEGMGGETFRRARLRERAATRERACVAHESTNLHEPGKSVAAAVPADPPPRLPTLARSGDESR